MKPDPTAESNALLPDALRMGAVHITVTDLDRSIGFYERSIGLRLREREGERAFLGAGGEDLLVLHEDPAARRPGRHAGLYHFALLHPSRHELARAAVRLTATRTPISGASDHKISEAIYLPDPDGNGIELAADRPRDQWPDLRSPLWDGGRPEPMDTAGLLALVEGEEPVAAADAGLAVGHVHLHIGGIEEALTHYRDVLGFEAMTTLPGATFVAAGGYHHHVGLNVWRGEGIPPEPEGVLGMRHFTLVLPAAADVDAVAERARESGAGVGESPDGVQIADPWNLKAHFTPNVAGTPL